LIRSARLRAQAGKDRQFEAWTQAVHAMSHEKHYLLDLIAASGETPRLRGRRLKLWLVLLICAVLAGVAIWMGLHPDNVKVFVPSTTH
jgi:hypothetical protein